MSMDHLLPSFVDEMRKIAVSVKSSPFVQTRIGRRPIRVHNVAKRESALYGTGDEEKSREEAKDVEFEAGQGMQDAEVGAMG